MPANNISTDVICDPKYYFVEMYIWSLIFANASINTTFSSI